MEKSRAHWFYSFAVLLTLGCSNNPPLPEITHQTRGPASETLELVYVTYDKSGQASYDKISPARWAGENGGFSEGGREDFLAKFYYANTRALSRKKIRHAACFNGQAQDIQMSFFSDQNPSLKIRNIESGYPRTKASSDGKMLGLGFRHNKQGDLFFRMSQCDAGKSNFSEQASSQKKSSSQVSFEKSKLRQVASFQDNKSIFGILDLVPNQPAKLPTFEVRGDYDKATVKDHDRPWKGMNLKDQKDQIRFALLLQKYFYEGMANQNSKDPDANFIAAKNPDRYWCHMPWLQVGESGREAIHGLTKERDLKPSKQMKLFSKATPGTDWGIGYFNSSGCQTLGKVFGTSQSPLPSPAFTGVNFEDGTVISKILFTTANFPEIQDAFTWTANVSEVGVPERSLKKVRHIQMDISVKDSSLIGALPELNHWIMLTYYFDPNFNYEKEIKPLLKEENPLLQIPNLPKAFLKMRPMGIQTGFDKPETGESVIFAGAETNGFENRLNGPADNPKSSCLGCHGTAGTTASMVPGFMDRNSFGPYKFQPALEFNQQLALAKRNFETADP